MPKRIIATGRTRNGRILLTYDLAYAAGKDAAMRRMRAEGRDHWGQEDYNLACRTMNDLLDKMEATCPK